MVVLERLADIYQQMAESYSTVATLLDFSCQGCPDNCCDSYFLHHTHIEWLYLWQGFCRLPDAKQKSYLERARKYVQDSEAMLARQERPAILCPLNDGGRCGLYSHRMMICRLHGVPASMTLPDGRKKSFPGCFRCQELVDGKSNAPAMDRTKFFREIVVLEKECLGESPNLRPKVKLTIAEMLLEGGPPE